MYLIPFLLKRLTYLARSLTGSLEEHHDEVFQAEEVLVDIRKALYVCCKKMQDQRSYHKSQGANADMKQHEERMAKIGKEMLAIVTSKEKAEAQLKEIKNRVLQHLTENEA